ncbi:MAG: glycosyltransferase family 39 protein [Candidatus Omnitrophica bacterium]|nr:glycosyltransferase family 39 protein [Candidatus Omnitrophota bacterium]
MGKEFSKGERSLKTFLLISLILFLALFLRLHTLSQKSFWYDEACSLQFAVNQISAIFSDHYLTRPLYFIFLQIWTSISGIGEFVSRLPSVIFGFLSVLFIYYLGKELFEKKTGIIAAFLLAVSYYHIAWSQQARNYSLLVFLCIISSLTYILAVKRGRLFGFCVYFIFAILAVLTSPIAILLFLFQIAILFKIIHIGKKSWSIASFLVTIPVFALIFLLYRFRNYVFEDLHAAGLPGVNISRIWELFNVFSSGGGYVAQGATAHQAGSSVVFLSIIIGILFLVFYIYGVFAGFWNKRKSTAYCLGWFWVPFLVLILLGLFGFNCFSPKYMIFALPAYYLIIARGIAFLSSKVILLIALMGIILSSYFHLSFYYNPPDYSSWREAAAYVEKYIRGSDRIIIIPSPQITPFWLYYKHFSGDFSSIGNGINGKVRLVNGTWRKEFYDGRNLVTGIGLDGVKAFIRENADKKSDLWVIVSRYWPGLGNYRMFAEYLQSNYIFVEKKEFSFDGIEILRYKTAQ